MSTHFEAVLDRLVEAFRRGSVTMWCGAGACVPSGLPDVASLVAEIVHCLELPHDEQRAITGEIPSRLPFEHFVELLVGNMDEKARADLLRLFELGSPCHYHHFIAQLVRRGFVASVITTNFDRHIEAALERERLANESDYRVHHEADQLNAIDWKSAAVPIVKLHGSVADIGRLGVTLRRVASPGSSARVVPVMRHVFGPDGAGIVLVLGYSFSDKFDILPAIRGRVEPGGLPSLVILDHQPEQPLRVTTVADDERHPLASYPGGLVVSGDTFAVVAAIASRLGLEVSEEEHPSEWRAFVAEYISDLDNRNRGIARPHLAGTLLEAVGRHEPALQYFAQAVEIADDTDETRWKYGARTSLAGAMIRVGKVPEATSVLNDALELSSGAWDGEYEDAALARVAELHLNTGFAEIQQALTLYRRCRATAAGGPDRLREVPYLSGIATCWMRLGDLDAAREAYRQALVIVEGSGDLFRKAEVYGNIGSLASIVRDHRAAREWYGKAIEVSRLAGDLERVGIHVMNLGNVNAKEGHFEKAIEMYDEARALLTPYKPATDAHLALIEKHEDTVRERMQLQGPRGSPGRSTEA